MGAYGFRGFYEKKEHFLKSIPFALENLKYLLENNNIPVELPELFNVLDAISQSIYLRRIGLQDDALTIRITSFSYKKGIPEDPSGNGGGYVFDCRAIHNPGRYEEYKQLTGKDQPVIDFLESNSDMGDFLKNVFGFSHLSVNFGCTGGQHRSAYAAEQLAAHLKEKYKANVLLSHREQDF